MSDHPHLVLIRGLPGSGKSTCAKVLVAEGYKHFEADMYFTAPDGTYKYDVRLINEAHEWCQDKAREALSRGERVVVANTFTRFWEMQPYIDMANARDIKYEVRTALGSYQNIHGTPEFVIQKMRDRWQEA